MSSSRAVPRVASWHCASRACPVGTVKAVTWLILPVVICLSQRLSHACLSMNAPHCEAANGFLIRYRVFDGTPKHSSMSPQPTHEDDLYCQWTSMQLDNSRSCLCTSSRVCVICASLYPPVLDVPVCGSFPQVCRPQPAQAQTERGCHG